MSRLTLPLLLAAATALGQPLQEKITVQVVEVPVYVERAGNSIPGLTRDDFELFVNGKPQAIEYFDVLDDVSTDAVPLDRRRLFVLLFDISSAHPFVLQEAKNAASRFIVESKPSDTFAVATLGRSGARFVVPFTKDRVALQRAVNTLARTRAADPFNLATLDTERREWIAAAGEGSIGSAADVFGENPVIGPVMKGSTSGESVDLEGTNAQAVQRTAESREFGKKNEDIHGEQNDRALVASLAALADRLAPLSGIKQVVLLSGRTERRENRDLFDLASEMHGRFRAAGVILSAIDIAVDKNAPSPRARTVDVGTDPMLGILTLQTGGAVATSFTSLKNMNRVTYVLGFRPSGPQKKQNEIKVKVKKAPFGTSVRYRKGYIADTPWKKNEDLLLADVLLNDIPQNGITVNLGVGVDQKSASLDAAMPGRELLAYAANAPLVMDVFMYVFNARNLPVDWTYSRLTLDPEKGREFLSSNPYSLRKTFNNLRPGKYAAKTVVRVVGSDIAGFGKADFEVK